MFEKTIDGTVYTITKVNGMNRFYEGDVVLLQEKDNVTFMRRLSELRYENLSSSRYDRWKDNTAKAIQNYFKEVAS